MTAVVFTTRAKLIPALPTHIKVYFRTFSHRYGIPTSHSCVDKHVFLVSEESSVTRRVQRNAALSAQLANKVKASKFYRRIKSQGRVKILLQFNPVPCIFSHFLGDARCRRCFGSYGGND